MAGVRTPTRDVPVCYNREPGVKTRGMLSRGTKVEVEAGVSSSKTPRRPQGLGALKESSSEEDLREMYSMTRGDPSFP